MGQLITASPPASSFGALLRACRHRAYLSQEELAARAELSERTVRNLEADRVRSPRIDTVRLLADALQLSGPERESWFEAGRGVNHQRADRAVATKSGPAHPPNGGAAQLPLPARGLGAGNNRWCHGSSAGGGMAAAIVELGQRGDGPAGQLTKDRDLTAAAVQAWLDLARGDAGARNDGLLTSADRRALAELCRENRRLREDVEVLKRAAAIFATATR
jgi:transposase